MLEQQVQRARAAGALDQLPIDLAALGTATAWSGDFATAAALIAESDAVCAATGSRAAPFTAMMLACLRADQDEAVPLIDATIAEATAGGQGIAVAYTHWAAAILGNALGRYADALTAAQQASADRATLYTSMWALPELIEAAMRSRDTRLAGQALGRLTETTQAGGTDFGLGIEAPVPGAAGRRARGRRLLPRGDRAAGPDPAPPGTGPRASALRRMAAPGEPAGGRARAAAHRARDAGHDGGRGFR
jgi:hypothetical protein